MSVPACPVFMRENLVLFSVRRRQAGAVVYDGVAEDLSLQCGNRSFSFRRDVWGIGWFRGRDDREPGFQNVPDIFGLISKRIRDFYVAPAAGDSLSDLHPRTKPPPDKPGSKGPRPFVGSGAKPRKTLRSVSSIMSGDSRSHSQAVTPQINSIYLRRSGSTVLFPQSLRRTIKTA